MIRFEPRHRLTRRLAIRPATYLDEIAPAIVGSSPEGITIDTEHPVYITAMKKYRRKPKRRARARTRAVKPQASPELATARFVACQACPHSRDEGFKCEFYTSCCFGRYRTRLESTCLDPGGSRWPHNEQKDS